MEARAALEQPRHERVKAVVAGLREGCRIIQSTPGMQISYPLPRGIMREQEYNKMIGFYSDEKATVADMLATTGDEEERAGVEVLREVLGENARFLDMTPQAVAEEIGSHGRRENSADFSNSPFNSHKFQLSLNAAAEGFEGLTYKLYVEENDRDKWVRIDHRLTNAEYISLVALGFNS